MTVDIVIYNARLSRFQSIDIYENIFQNISLDRKFSFVKICTFNFPSFFFEKSELFLIHVSLIRAQYCNNYKSKKVCFSIFFEITNSSAWDLGIIFVTGDTAAALSVDQTAESNPIINLQNNGDHVVTGDMNMGHINVIYYKSATMLKTVRCQLGDEAKDLKIFHINLTTAT